MPEHYLILIVDNNEAYCKTLREYLEENSYHIIEARNAEEALEKVVQEKPALITVDVRLVDDDDPHDHSGLRLIQRLPEEIPVIVLTAYEDAQVIRTAYETAPGKVLPKAYRFKGDGLEAIQTTIALYLPKDDEAEPKSSKPLSLRAITIWLIPVAVIAIVLLIIFGEELIAGIVALTGSVLAELLAGAFTTIGRKAAKKIFKGSQPKIHGR